jgi:hypothetical protein
MSGIMREIKKTPEMAVFSYHGVELILWILPAFGLSTMFPFILDNIEQFEPICLMLKNLKAASRDRQKMAVMQSSA